MIDSSLFARRRVDEALRALLAAEDSSVHGYTPAPGLPALREVLVRSLVRYDFPLSSEGIYVTCGRAAGAAILNRALLEKGEEVLFLCPPDDHLRSAVEAVGAAAVEGGVIGGRTRLVVLSGDSPVTDDLAAQLRAAEERSGRPVWLLADRLAAAPYTESLLHEHASFVLLEDFGGALDGECLGFLAVGADAPEADTLCAAIAGAGRAMGYVNPPSLMQRAVLACLNG